MFRNQKNTKPAPTGDAVAPPVTFRSDRSAHKLQYDAQVSDGRANEAHDAAQRAYSEAQAARNSLDDLRLAKEQLEAQLREVEQKRADALRVEQEKRAEGDRLEAERQEYLAQAADARMILNLAGVTTDTFPTPNGARPDATHPADTAPDDGFARFIAAHDEDDTRAGGE
jgi:Fic family protein